jgi:hypothetical protein
MWSSCLRLLVNCPPGVRHFLILVWLPFSIFRPANSDGTSARDAWFPNFHDALGAKKNGDLVLSRLNSHFKTRLNRLEGLQAKSYGGHSMMMNGEMYRDGGLGEDIDEDLALACGIALPTDAGQRFESSLLV